MLTVYSKETTSFSTLGIGVLRDFLSNPLITEELNGAYTLEFQYAKDQDYPGNPVVKTLPSNAGDVGLMPSWGAKLPHTSWLKNQPTKQTKK